MADVPIPGVQNHWTQNLASLNPHCHAITNKYPEAGSVVQQVYKVLNEIEIIAGCAPAKEGESPEWNTIVNCADKNRINFCKILDGKPHLRPLTLNKLKAMSA
jgi:hypothetical protein